MVEGAPRQVPDGPAPRSHLSLLADAAAQLISAQDPVALVRDLFDLVADELMLDAVVNYDLVDEEPDGAGQWLRLTAYRGISDEIATGHECLVASATASIESMTSILREAGFKGLACMPLMMHGRLIGTLGFGRRTDPFDQDELFFLQTLSTYVASAKDRVRAYARLQASEKRLRVAAALAGFGSTEWDPVTFDIYVSPEMKAIYGLPPDQRFTFEDLVQAVHPDDRVRVNSLLDNLVDPKGAGEFTTEYRIVWPSGEVRWMQALACATFAGTGNARRAVKCVGAAIDITDQKRLEEQIRANEHRYRVAQELGGVGIFDWDMETGLMEVTNVFRRICGLPSNGVVTINSYETLVHPEDMPTFRAAVAQAWSGDGHFDAEYRIIRQSDHQIRWIHDQGGAIFNGEGRRTQVIGVIRDVTERRRAQERERLLTREVDHRAKNLLAVIQSVVQLTRADNLPQFIEAVTGRIQALGRAHSLLASTRWEGAELATLVEEEIAPFAPYESRRVRFRGPQIKLKPGAAQSIALVLHELATNAAKYGALSEPGGRVEIEWRVDDRVAGDLLMTWTERGGPPVKPPARAGFGSSVMRASVERQLGGVVTMHWQREGLRCELRLPAKQLVRGPEEPVVQQPLEERPRTHGCVGGTQVLVLEDEGLVAMEMVQSLEKAGCIVVGPAANISEALDLIHDKPIDVALVDIDLGGSRGYPVADVLSERGVPFAFVTGFNGAILPERFHNVPLVPKPASSAMLERTIEDLIAEAPKRSNPG